jgi:hypothetical protein
VQPVRRAEPDIEPSLATDASPIRVSVRKSALDPNLWVVRPLTEGAIPPPGARVGSLVVFGEEDDEGDASSGSAVG